MKNALNITVFTIIVILFYWYVGQQVTQKETHPPKSLEIRPGLTSEEMVEIGGEIVSGKGTCLGCHTIGSNQAGRFPDLGNVGAVASGRKEGLSDIEYLAESVYAPDAYIVEGFLPGMAPIQKPPINLSDPEILTVIAYLQSLGGEPTVTMDTKLKWAGSTPPSTAVGSETLDAKGLLSKYLCVSCHSIDTPTKLVGPSFYDIGTRLTKASLYEAILEPDATVGEGYPPGVMQATLSGAGFYDRVSTEELKVMADYLASLRGDK